ncbi:non-ribosomal peptide synthetase [Brevibacillus dissolubilis]|uniref:non-ribosomal peptide synthetase n=1 Tax=Brevibacillus dissolubilis TaxID=1844116 RepID=UPI001115F1FB|nr:non-ribosomal peptide synthetase [Brevibacillus dissolubilis]
MNNNKYLQTVLNLVKNKEISKEAGHTLLKEYMAHTPKSSGTEEENKIAIIGMSCRMPEATSKEAFWHNIKLGKDSIRHFPTSRRKDIDDYLSQINPNLFAGDDAYWQAGYLDEIDKFDHELFQILPGEAKYMDPQQRIFLEMVYEAVEDAGYGNGKINNTKTGVYIGNCPTEYGMIANHQSPLAVTGTNVPIIASRVNYVFNLRGPALAFSSTCSSSLVAVHYAVQALLNGECEQALTGAINLYLFPVDLVTDSAYRVGIVSEESRCRTFDNAANGVVRGEGGAVLLLKPLKRALADGDHIYGTIIGTGVNNDGLSTSISAPNPVAQAEMLTSVWKKANIDPRSIAYLEAHGTGTKLGDPIEIAAITRAFAPFTKERQFCGIGSVKSNIGHLVNGASGIAGLIKTVLALKHKQLPPTLHFEDPNPLIDFLQSPVYVVDRLQDWKTEEEPRRAGVSAFGFNGTNAHILLEEAPLPDREQPEAKGPFLFVLSARKKTIVRELIQRYIAFLKENPDIPLGNVCFTAATGRQHHPVRVAMVTHSVEDLVMQLENELWRNDEVAIAGTGAVHDQERITDPLLEITARYLAGETINWDQLYADGAFTRIPLPTYPFERVRHWVDQSSLAGSTPYTFGLAANAADSAQSVEVEQLPLDLIQDVKTVESRLVAIMSLAMGVSDLDKDSDFFRQGGDSLLGMQVINAINNELKTKITVEQLFMNPVIADLAKAIFHGERGHYDTIEVQPVSDSYPASFSQRRMWILDQMQTKRIAYNMAQAVSVTGAIDRNVLREALQIVMERQESLRTLFFEENGELRQKILEQLNVQLEYMDLTSQLGAEELAKGYIEEAKNQPFDLEQGPLWRVQLYEVGHESYHLLLVMHHIISDGWSMELFISELLTIYHSLCRGESVELEPNRIQYKDYCAWQNQFLSDQSIKHQEKFWLEQFAEEIPVCEIVGDLSRPSVFHFEGGRRSFVLDPVTSEKLKQVALDHQATLYMTLLSSVYLLLHRYSGKRNLIIGSPISGRAHFDVKNLIGSFVNTLAIQTTVDPEASIGTFISDVKERVIQCFENQDYPFDLLIDKLQLTRDTSRSPLFNINVVLQNANQMFEKDWGRDLFKVEPIHFADHTSAKWDLEFEFVEMEDGSIQCLLEYYTGIYSPEMIESLIDNYLCLLDSIATDPDQTVSQLQLLSPKRREQVVNGFNKGEIMSVPDLTLHEWFTQQAASGPDTAAIMYNDQTLTYAEVERRTNQLAHFLLENGIRENSHVGILMENHPATILSILAILKTGAAYVPLDTKHPLSRLQMIVEEAAITFVLSTKKHIGKLNRLQWECPTLQAYICLDSSHVHAEEEDESESNELMNQEIWDYVAESAHDAISGSGWVSSYTGEHFSQQEMDEYSQNVLNKLKPYLHPSSTVLEIGCGSGITLFNLAPYVSKCVGTDLSKKIIENNIRVAAERGYTHVDFQNIEAHHIDQVETQAKFDVIILNSVIHCFNGHNYLRQVIQKALQLLADDGILFIGDVMDGERKRELVQSLEEFKRQNQGKGYKTKTEWDTELFIWPAFWTDLQADFAEITSVHISNKHYTISNELTEYRYDVILQVNKEEPSVTKREKRKVQYDLTALTDCSLDPVSVKVSPDQAAYIIFTSGSTGKPKGVVIEHRSAVNYIWWSIHYYFGDLLEKPMFPVYSSLGFDLTVTSIFVPLLSGAALTIYDDHFDDVLSKMEKDGRSNAIKLTPAHLGYLLQSPYRIESLRTFIVGGESLNASLAAQLFALEEYKQVREEICIYNEYGPTEATVGCIVFKIQDHNLAELKANVQIGKPIANTSIYILDEQRQPVPIGVSGEIYIAGKGLARGYLRNDQATAEKFIHNPFSTDGFERMYRTGDLGRFLPDGTIEFLGRIDRQVKIRSYRIELDEVESVLLTHEQIKEAFVIDRNGENGTKILCAYYVAQEELGPNELRGHLLKSLPEYMVPTHFIPIHELPLSINGKVEVKRLPDPVVTFSKERKFIGPRNSTEEKIGMIWAGVLGVSSVSIHDDFFELGGDSIKAIQAVSKAKELGIQLSVKDIFEHKTIEALSDYDSFSSQTHWINQEEVSGEIPLTPIQHWFKELHQPYPNYFHMARIFQLPVDVDLGLLEQVFTKLIEHHDLLRSRYVITDGEISQYNRSIEEAPAFKLDSVDLRAVPAVERMEKLKELSVYHQNQLNLSEDLLIKAIVFDLAEQGKYLLLIVHHLVIDGVSWRFMLQDVERLYDTKLTEPLPRKTTSYKEWSSKLENFAKEEAVDVSYWLQLDAAAQTNLVTKTNDSIHPATYAHKRIGLDPVLTETLRRMASKEYSTNMNVLLLAGLIDSVSNVFSTDDVLITLEGHGREELFPDLDISRTIGWFTSMYPVHVSKQQSKRATVEVIKKTLESLPNNGVNYGIGRYLQRIPQLERLSPQILFNYFGEAKGILSQKEGTLLTASHLDFGSVWHPENRLSHPLEFNAMIDETGCLWISIDYQVSAFETEDIDQLGNRLKRSLAELAGTVTLVGNQPE